MKQDYLSIKDIAERFGVHRATPWRWVQSDPHFPKPVKLSAGCTRWRLSEIIEWERQKLDANS